MKWFKSKYEAIIEINLNYKLIYIYFNKKKNNSYHKSSFRQNKFTNKGKIFDNPFNIFINIGISSINNLYNNK